ncbi:cortex morphogenetic protein CmpA [Gorillibacterium sp. CAU 1737]|uniref:cortex morphogenetic protein CmpA n=1 Tax=Gorillibacterium sp. CAU 1737 TaxID=3140362 RepID=UPI0032617274
MPQWLSNQLMRAFQTKNVRKIKLLNDCWYFYRVQGSGTEERTPNTPNQNR